MNKHHVMTDNDGTSSIASQPAPPFSADEHTGWEPLCHETAGVFLFMFKIGPEETKTLFLKPSA